MQSLAVKNISKVMLGCLSLVGMYEGQERFPDQIRSLVFEVCGENRVEIDKLKVGRE